MTTDHTGTVLAFEEWERRCAMWCENRVRTFLRDEDLDYARVMHREAFTAQGVAAASRVPARETAKTIIVRDAGGRYLMAVVPATCRLDVDALTRASGHPGLALATEAEVERLFPDCEPGAVPPFGNMYDIPTFVDACLADGPEIYFPIGSRQETLGMPFAEYAWAARPMLGVFCAHPPRTPESTSEP
jgi:Ala-tRNA(Pro) deacylase